jgi:uncharacterized protein YjbJ (UPF0337 family)/ElaB/YqjD/DUF883 family membrane-anchored ribosome-binding protein
MMSESYDNPSTRPPGTVPTSGDLDETLPPSYPAGSGTYPTGTLGTTTYETGVYAGESSEGSSGKAAEVKEKAAEVKDQVKGEAAGVKQTAVEAGGRVAGTAKEQAANVAGEARRQAKDILQQGRSQLTSQVGGQQQKAAGAIRALSTELSTMASSSDSPGVASDLAAQAAGVVDSVASWFENREPADVLQEVTSFARQRPGVFLAIAAGAGLVVGRLARSLKDEASADQQAQQSEYVSAGYTTATTGYTTDTYATTTADPYATPVAPSTPVYGTTPPAYGTGTTPLGAPDVPGTTTGGYGGTA